MFLGQYGTDEMRTRRKGPPGAFLAVSKNNFFNGLPAALTTVSLILFTVLQPTFCQDGSTTTNLPTTTSSSISKSPPSVHYYYSFTLETIGEQV